MRRTAVSLAFVALVAAKGVAAAPPEPACGPAHVDEVLAVDHFLFLPDEATARAAAEELGESRYRQQVHQAATSAEWVLYLEHQELPARERFAADTDQLRALAGRHGGRYGWHGCITDRFALGE